MCRERVFPVLFGLVLSLVLVGAATADITTGLIGYWPLDGNAEDASGNDLHGTVNGGVVPAPDRFGVPDSAMMFDGDAASNITVADHPLLNLTGEMTLAAWVFLNSTNTNNSRIISKSGAGGARSWSLNIEATSGGVDHPATFQVASSGSTNLSLVDSQPLPTDEWAHMAGVYRPGEAMELYVNGELRRTNTAGIPATQYSDNNLSVMIGARNACNNCTWNGFIDEARIYKRALSAEEIQAVLRSGGLATEFAGDPSPTVGATDVPHDTILSWKAGKYAATHDLYLGPEFADVNNADRASPGAALVSQGQTDAAFGPTDLEYGQTYYWRIDEVNAPPDNTIFKGDVWNFTTEPFGYPIANVTATASSTQTGMGPENTVNGSGLNANDEHSTELTTMWLSAGTQPTWIQYEFDKAYKLHELWVWNSNQLIEAFVGFGARDVTVEYSVDGQTWATLDGAPEFAQATGSPAYKANTVVEFDGVEARFVRLTITKAWGVAPQTGLSEVRFFYIPVQAFGPQPAVAATGVSLDTDLSWRPGRQALSHDVYMGTDENALTLADRVAVHTYTPASLDFGTTYFWKVNEIGDGSAYEGETWSFTTQEYAVIEDFESYNDDDNRIYDSWIDGLTDAALGGSQVGYDVSPFAERIIVHGGRQSMPFMYNNEGSPFYSEAEREFATVQNWTVSGADTLSLWAQGAPADLYAAVQDGAGKTAVVSNPPAATTAGWTQWKISLSDFTGVDMSRVKKVYLGVGNKAAPVKGGAGTFYIDDIGFGHPAQ